METIKKAFLKINGYFKKYPGKSIIYLVVCVVVLLVLWNVTAYFLLLNKESSLFKKYSEDPSKKIYIEQMIRDKEDLSKNPGSKEAAIDMDMGLQWYGLLHYDLAARWWVKGLNLEPNNDIGWNNLGNAYREIKEFGKAERAYRRGMDVSAKDEIDCCLSLGEMYKYQYTRKKDKEGDVYLGCLQKHTDNRDLIARLALYYRDSGNKQNALKYFDKLFSIDPSSSEQVGEEIRKLQEELRQEGSTTGGR